MSSNRDSGGFSESGSGMSVVTDGSLMIVPKGSGYLFPQIHIDRLDRVCSRTRVHLVTAGLLCCLMLAGFPGYVAAQIEPNPNYFDIVIGVGESEENRTSFTNNGTISNHGILFNYETFNNNRILFNYETFNNSVNSTLNNSATLLTYRTLNNSGTLNNSHHVVNYGALNNSGTLVLETGSSLYTGPGGYYTGAGLLHVYGGAQVFEWSSSGSGEWVPGNVVNLSGDGTLGFNNMGSIAYGQLQNFQNLGIFGGTTSLAGPWDFSSGSTTVHAGVVDIMGILEKRFTSYPNRRRDECCRYHHHNRCHYCRRNPECIEHRLFHRGRPDNR